MTFDVEYHATQHYPVIIYSTSYLNPLGELAKVASALQAHIKEPSQVLFDLLLSNGEESNRFVLGYFDGKKIAYNSLKCISIDDFEELRQINQFYKSKFSYLNNSVLTAKQRLKFAKS